MGWSVCFWAAYERQYKIMRRTGVLDLWHSAALSILHHRMSETWDVWNRAVPIFDAWCWILTSQSKSRGSYSGLTLKYQKRPISVGMTIFKLIRIQTVFPLLLGFSSPTTLLFFPPCNSSTSCKIFWKNHMLSSSEDVLGDAILMIYPCISWDLSSFGTALTKMLCVCC